MNENKILLPIENIETRSSKSKKSKKIIRGRAKLTPGKQYAYLFDSDEQGNPIKSLKEVFSEQGWNTIKKKIMGRGVFVDDNHKTVIDLKLNRYLNDLSRETGKNLDDIKAEIKRWIKASDMPLFKLEDAQLEDDSVMLEIAMNPYFRDIDESHKAYYDAVSNSVDEGFLNSLSLNFSPTDWTEYITDQGTCIPMINDCDVYGISLVHHAGHDDMQDVLEVSMRAVQDVITKNNQTGDGTMTKEQLKEEIKKDLKQEKKEEDLQSQIVELRKQNEEKDKALKEQNEVAEAAKVEAEKNALVLEKEKLEAQLVEKDKMLQQQSTPSKGFAPQHVNTTKVQADEQWRQDFKVKLEQVSDGQSPLAKAIVLQAENNTLGLLPEETQRAARDTHADIHLHAKR